MKIVLFLIDALAICFLNIFLVAETDSPVTRSLEKHLSYCLSENYRHGKYGPLQVLKIQRGKQILFQKSPSFNSPYGIESITKSISALVIGIALKRGDIKTVNQKVLDFFPEYKQRAGAGWESVRLIDLLTMRSGIEWEEDKRPECANPTYKMYTAENTFNYIFSRKISNEKSFNYTSANAALLSGIIFKVSGKSFASYADEVLFKPLKITNYKWSTYKNKSTNTSGGLYLCFDDLEKIGRLYLQNGMWEGKKLVEKSWIGDSFESHSAVKGYLDVNAYGYMWWLNGSYKICGSDQPVKICSACGYNNNHLILIPQFDLLIITIGDSTSQPEKYFNLVEDVLIGLLNDSSKVF